jgi:hypothetical protein
MTSQTLATTVLGRHTMAQTPVAANRGPYRTATLPLSFQEIFRISKSNIITMYTHMNIFTKRRGE